MNKNKKYYVYILASHQKTIYIGITNGLKRRMFEHQQKLLKGFSEKYKCNKLVYHEETNDIRIAIEREKQLKKWRRDKKEFIINKNNSDWKDLSVDI